jgi:predicted phage terminase large subunit-like protein
MMSLDADEYQVMARLDLHTFIHRAFLELNPSVSFSPNWHLELIAAKLEACRRGEIKRLIINVPPRSLKSLCATVAFPAFVLGHDPSAQIICCSYSQELANKHALDCRTLMTSACYQGLFSTRLALEKQAVQEFMTTRNGFRLATSVGGVLTGRGADYLLIDDPSKPEEALSNIQRTAVNDWFDHTLYSRLNDKRNGRIVVVTQRLHLDDLVGHVLEQEPWDIVRLPAIAEQDESHVISTPFFGTRTVWRRAGEALHPEREPLEVLNHLRRTLGEYNFSGQYQQGPSPLGGGLVKLNWFKRYILGQEPTKFDMIIQSWDTANKSTELSDYSVCTTWGRKGRDIYLLHVLRKRLEYPELKRAVRDQAQRFHPDQILIEDMGSGTALIQELKRDAVDPIWRYTPPTMDKIMRLHAVTSIIENGQVYLPEKAEWLDAYIQEMTTFPKSKYNDQADSTSQALEWIKRRPVTHPLIEYFERQAKTFGLQNQLQEANPSVGMNPKTGQKLRWNGKCWVDFHTGERYPDQ